MKSETQPKTRGIQILIVALYAVLSMAALGRSIFQIVRSSPDIPIAYWLSALAAVVYLIATISLFLDGKIGRKIAWASITFELVGVLVVGTISLAAPGILGQDHTDITGSGATVWTGFGLGYVLIPLFLPIIGLIWLSRANKRDSAKAALDAVTTEAAMTTVGMTTQVHYSVDTLPPGLASVVSVGKFDGVHIGHRSIIQRMKTIAEAEGLATVLVTFDRNPLDLIAPDRSPVPITNLAQKIALLSTEDIDYILVLEFNQALKDQEPREFVELLAQDLGAKVILVGQDFRFGQQGLGNVSMLHDLSAELGFRVELVDDQLKMTAHHPGKTTDNSVGIDAVSGTDTIQDTGAQRISSSMIRQFLTTGEVEQAAELLGRNHEVSGTVVHGLKRGREMGFPTANLQEVPEGMIPTDGVYAGWLKDGDTRYAAVISIGDNPTFNDVFHKQVEAYLPGINVDLYDHVVTVEFQARIRGMVAFDSIDELIKEMHNDEITGLALLGVDKPSA